MSPGNPFTLGSKRHESQKNCRRGSLHSCECWLLIVFMFFYGGRVNWKHLQDSQLKLCRIVWLKMNNSRFDYFFLLLGHVSVIGVCLQPGVSCSRQGACRWWESVDWCPCVGCHSTSLWLHAHSRTRPVRHTRPVAFTFALISTFYVLFCIVGFFWLYFRLELSYALEHLKCNCP